MVAWAIKAYIVAAFSGSGLIFFSSKSFFKCKKYWCLYEKEMATFYEHSWYQIRNKYQSMNFLEWIARQKISSGKILISLMRRCFHISPCRILKQILWLDEEFYAKLQTIRWCTGNLSTNPVSRIQPENFAFWPTELKSKIVKLNNSESFADLANRNK